MTKESLVEELIKDGYLKTAPIIDAFRKIDRKDFVPKELTGEAYGNYPLPIGFGQTISQPLTVAFMLELLQPQPGEKILDVGCGSGWQTALLARLVGGSPDANRKPPEGKAIGIERIPKLSEMAENNIRKYNFIEKKIAKITIGDGSRGYPEEAPFDKIIAAASAEWIPAEWKKQLKVGGRIVAPVGQSILKLDKISDKEFKTKEYFGFSFVPLIEDE